MAKGDDPAQLTIADLKAGLAELGEAAAHEGKIIDLCVYGGSSLMLVSDFRIASQDVDAVAVTDQNFVDRIARDIAKRRSWAEDWLNDGVRTYLSPFVEAPEQHVLAGTYPSEERPGIRVYVPTAEYMLAMKLMSMRIDAFTGDKDRDDIENLISVVGITSKDALVALAGKYYPEAKTSAKIYLAADSLVNGASEKSKNDHAPEYLGRSGKAGHGRSG